MEKKVIKVFVLAGVLGTGTLGACAVMADENVYGEFPITVEGYSGSQTNSVSYTGQIARHVLHESLKKLAGKGNGNPNPALKAKMISYYAGKGGGRSIISPTTNGGFLVKQAMVDQISKNKNLMGKTYKGAITGMPNNMTGSELVRFWIDKASVSNKGVDVDNGYNYPQLISKFIMGAVFYNQVVDNYLDEKLGANNKPNNEPYKKGAPYTGKEHSWDEGFGYFGVVAHGLKLSPVQLYSIAKRKAKAMEYADWNGDGKIDLYREMVFAPAYYAAAFDKSNKSSYAATITKAFLNGRRLISSAKGAALSDAQRSQLRKLAAIIDKNWELALAEAVFKYAGSCIKDLGAIQSALGNNQPIGRAARKYIKHWGELKGFSLALQTGKNNLGETGVRLNRLIGYGPVLPNSSQVTDIDSKGNYVKSQSSGLREYMVHMLKVQKLMIDSFALKARGNDRLAKMGYMIKNLGGGYSAEND